MTWTNTQNACKYCIESCIFYYNPLTNVLYHIDITMLLKKTTIFSSFFQQRYCTKFLIYAQQANRFSPIVMNFLRNKRGKSLWDPHTFIHNCQVAAVFPPYLSSDLKEPTSITTILPLHHLVSQEFLQLKAKSGHMAGDSIILRKS